jgi:hypothetical protein
MKFQPSNLRRFAPRFRTSSLLWLVVVVAAFFVGRQSDEIALQLSKLRNSIWPNTAAFILSQQPDGSLVFDVGPTSPSRRILINGTACAARRATPDSIRLTPISDGTTELKILQSDGSGTLIILEVKNGKFASTTNRKIPATRNASARTRVQ